MNGNIEKWVWEDSPVWFYDAVVYLKDLQKQKETDAETKKEESKRMLDEAKEKWNSSIQRKNASPPVG